MMERIREEGREEKKGGQSTRRGERRGREKGCLNGERGIGMMK